MLEVIQKFLCALHTSVVSVYLIGRELRWRWFQLQSILKQEMRGGWADATRRHLINTYSELHKDMGLFCWSIGDNRCAQNEKKNSEYKGKTLYIIRGMACKKSFVFPFLEKLFLHVLHCYTAQFIYRHTPLS